MGALPVRLARQGLREVRTSPFVHRVDELFAVVECLEDVVPALGLLRKESLRNRLVDEGRHMVDRDSPFAHVERAEPLPVRRDGRRRADRLHVEHESARNDRRMDPVQSVHDALERYASQRPAAEGDVERMTWRIELLSTGDCECHDGGHGSREARLRIFDRLLVRVEGEHLSRPRGGELG